jgi:penicillin-binding protein
MRKNLFSSVIFIAVFGTFLGGCGYAPASKITQNILDESVFVDVRIDKIDPKNSVAIKDAIRKGISSRLGRTLALKGEANSEITASIRSLSFEALTYDQLGYVTSFRANLTINFTTILKNGELFSVNTSGDHDFRVARLVKKTRDTSSIISDKDRYNAIENASAQAFDEFIARLAIKGVKLK